MDLGISEVKVLKTLEREGETRFEELCGKVSLDADAVTGILHGLQEKGLVYIDVEEKKFYKLGFEGEEFAEKGLPEKRLLTRIPVDGVNVQELMGEGEAEVAIGWLKKRNWVEIDGGVVKPTEKGLNALDQRLLDEEIISILSKGRETVESLSDKTGTGVERVGKVLQRLAGRGDVLIELERKERKTGLTREGEKVVEGKVSEKRRESRLTHEMLVEGSWREKEFKEFDVSVEAGKYVSGKIHPYRRLLNRMREIFVSMGFKEIKSPTIESGFWNFDALFQPQSHPAREMQDTFYLKKPGSLEIPGGEKVERVRQVHEDGGSTGSSGWGGEWSVEEAKQALLRTHTTSATVRHLHKVKEPPVKVFCLDRAYRRETVDATHLPQFFQLEGILMDEDASFKHLLGCLETFYSEMGFKDVRFRPAYFPYTEPSVEPEVYVDELGEWMELGGAGVFREEVTAPAGVEHPVLAWGLGVGRLAMLRLGLTDIRDLYLSDIDWLRGERICRL